MSEKKDRREDVAFTAQRLREAVQSKGGKPPSQAEAEARVRKAIVTTERREAGG